MTTLCELATKLPMLVETLLDREATLKRGRFREETMTDIFTASLATFAGPNLVIQYPPESTTGGDLDLDFWNVEARRRLRVRIQAKRLNAEMNNKKPIKIEHRSYAELLHKVPGTRTYQFRTLAQTAAPFVPLYMFYNHGAVVDDPYFAGMVPEVRGINLAFADDIASEMEAKLQAKPKRLHHKRLSHLRKYFFDLGMLLCPPASSTDGVPTPGGVSDSLRLTWAKIEERSAAPDVSKVVRKLSSPESLLGTTFDGRLIPDGPSVRFSRGIKRPLITFISGRTDDQRTPQIHDDLRLRKG